MYALHNGGAPYAINMLRGLAYAVEDIVLVD